MINLFKIGKKEKVFISKGEAVSITKKAELDMLYEKISFNAKRGYTYCRASIMYNENLQHIKNNGYVVDFCKQFNDYKISWLN